MAVVFEAGRCDITWRQTRSLLRFWRGIEWASGAAGGVRGCLQSRPRKLGPKHIERTERPPQASERVLGSSPSRTSHGKGQGRFKCTVRASDSFMVPHALRALVMNAAKADFECAADASDSFIAPLHRIPGHGAGQFGDGFSRFPSAVGGRGRGKRERAARLRKDRARLRQLATRKWWRSLGPPPSPCRSLTMERERAVSNALPALEAASFMGTPRVVPGPWPHHGMWNVEWTAGVPGSVMDRHHASPT